MVYLNQAATTWPKPPRVLEAHAAALSAAPEGQFRSSARGGRDVMEACRQRLGALLGIADADRIFFSSGATDALNALVRGLPLDGGRVLATQAEHNSVLRPLMNHGDRVGAVDIVLCDAAGRVDIEAAEALLGEGAAALFVNHCSNVTGAVQDVPALARAAHRHGALLVLDVAQSAGCLPVEADVWGVDALAFTGHKALFGPQGTGGYYVRAGVPFAPFRYGGTGLDSRRLTYGPGEYEYEPGTQNLPGIAALLAGVEYVLERGVENIREKERALTRGLREGLSSIGGVTVYGADPDHSGPVVSFNFDGLAASDAAYILDGYGIRVRAGLHCAPLIHAAMGAPDTGTVRASVSDMNAPEDIDRLLEAAREISAGLGGRA